MNGEKYQRFKLRKFSISRKILDHFEFDGSTTSQKRSGRVVFTPLLSVN